MANCKKCGRPVVTAPVYCPECQEKTGGWISVEDRLPEPGERVLVTNGIFVCEAYLNISNKWVRAGVEVFFITPSCWMPLPEPPGKEGKL